MERISNSQLEILINCGINKLDRSRTISALQELKEHRKNQPKYEKALQKACSSLVENEICPIGNCEATNLMCRDDNEPQCDGNRCPPEIFVDYFKKQAGLEV